MTTTLYQRVGDKLRRCGYEIPRRTRRTRRGGHLGGPHPSHPAHDAASGSGRSAARDQRHWSSAFSVRLRGRCLGGDQRFRRRRGSVRWSAAGCWPRSCGPCRPRRSSWRSSPHAPCSPAAAVGSPCRPFRSRTIRHSPGFHRSPARLGSSAFAAAVSQVAIAAGRDDTLPVLTGVRIEIAGEKITLASTDRYRLAVRELIWRPEDPEVTGTALIPARTLADAAKALAVSWSRDECGDRQRAFWRGPGRLLLRRPPQHHAL